jgi:hypothetical protein
VTCESSLCSLVLAAADSYMASYDALLFLPSAARSAQMMTQSSPTLLDLILLLLVLFLFTLVLVIICLQIYLITGIALVLQRIGELRAELAEPPPPPPPAPIPADEWLPPPPI